MKKYLLLVVMVLTCQIGLAQGASDLYSKYAQAKNAESVNVSSLLIKFAKLFMDDDDAKALKGVDSMKILDLDDCSTDVKSQFLADVDKLENEGYEPLMEAKKNEGNTRFLLRRNGDIVREFLIVSRNSGDCALIKIEGKMALQDVVQLAESSKEENGRVHISL